MRANFARHARHIVVRRAYAPSCALFAAPARRRPITRPVVCRTFERTFLDILFKKAPREVRQPEYEPGWMQIMIWRSRMLDKLRPPTRKDLMAAWRKLIQFKLRNGIPLNSTQALQCRRLLEYLTEPRPDDQNASKLSTADLAQARKVLLEIEPIERSREHLSFARALNVALGSGEVIGKPKEPEQLWSYMVRAMSRFGNAEQAAAELYEKWRDPAYEAYITGNERVLEDVARGLAYEGREKDLLDIVNYAEEHSPGVGPELQEIITVFFAQRGRVRETKDWFADPPREGHRRPGTYREIALFAMRNKLENWATPFLLELGQSQPRKSYWDVLLQAMLFVGMRLEEVQSMMSHMVSHNGPVSPDTATINSMLRAAAEMVDPRLADEILAIALGKSIRPDAETYLILLSMHMAAGSVAEAKAAFEKLQYAGTMASDNTALWTEYGQMMNRYLLFLCHQRPPDFTLILQLLETVEEERLHLAPETVGSLCLRFLENDQSFEVMDILSVHVFLYSEAQRDVVQDVFVRFCQDPNTSTSRAWGAYQLLQQFFQDLSFERRVQLLDAFFDRKRPDMATYVFSHMRQHRNRSFQPDLATYVKCFEGFAENPDRDGTEKVHNMLKMDTRVHTNTRLNTALMLAYAACERPLKALDFWNEIKLSPEGPSYSSLEAVFWTLERKSGGAKMAREIWDKIEAMDVEVSPTMFTAYVGAIAASGNEKEVRSLVLKMASYTGSEPDAMT